MAAGAPARHASNRDGLGAKVVVKAGGRTLTQWAGRQVRVICLQSSMPLYFGLDGVKAIDGVEVTWPSGIVQSVKAKPNTILEVKEKGKP